MLWRRITSTVFWGYVILTSIVLFPIALLVWALTVALDRRRVILHEFTCFWGSIYTWSNPSWPVTVQGRENIDRSETYVMVANHMSLLDILVLFRLFVHFKWVSKQENFKVPLVGWNMRLNGYIPLKRGDRESVAAMMAQCVRALNRGSSIMMFPEGTRSFDGRLKPFKPGSFDLALKTQRPILPIVIEGSAEALPKRGFLLRGHHPITVTILEPIPYTSFADASVQQLSDEVRGRIAAALPPAHRPASAGPAA
jgi:1-acyl-sn-glycerol-3-phosphate acyltransferase